MSLKRFRPALADCQKASGLQSAAPNSKTLVRLARCHFSLGEIPEAISVLAPVLASLDPDNSAARSLDAQVKRVQEHLRQFRSYRDSGNYTLASIAMDKAQADVEEVPLIWRIWRGEALLLKGAIDAASSVASDALRLDQNNPDALQLRARVLYAKGELAKAIAHAQAALRSDPDFVPARNLLKKCRKLETKKEEGNAAFKAGKNEEAVEK